ncbi:response regulator transcription factor [Streptomyces roseoverticillatus]|uniref:helix-turn-helix transcriptional regulator n=1 Tax=Streptomyces roseoverticillatus TaxID=66429 RepID=UPI001F372581|nr:response regulator transcription factor [Streptomyces roseoverticillatus]MCF3106774.1 response regulator transcription factor [Streptomyces roseoverticillatus]
MQTVVDFREEVSVTRSSLEGSTRAPAGIERGDCSIVLVGSWLALPLNGCEHYEGAYIHSCPDRDELIPVVHARQADWLLAGPELDDGDIQRLFAGANAVRENVRLAVLGHARDWRRCDRWMRRGCRVYLEETILPRRAVAAIQAAHGLGVNIMDRVFSEVLRERATGPAPHLTRRERDVLDLLRRGLRNREIAGALFVSENTVEYHMRHLLSKFSARNRMEVVERAVSLGLA